MARLKDLIVLRCQLDADTRILRKCTYGHLADRLDRLLVGEFCHGRGRRLDCVF